MIRKIFKIITNHAIMIIMIQTNTCSKQFNLKIFYLIIIISIQYLFEKMNICLFLLNYFSFIKIFILDFIFSYLRITCFQDIYIKILFFIRKIFPFFILDNARTNTIIMDFKYNYDNTYSIIHV